MVLPTLDAHAHLDPSHSTDELSGSGAVLAMSLSLDEAECATNRNDPYIAWGVGCHPRFPHAQEDFDVKRFRSLAEGMAFVGEVGLDTGAPVPMEIQLRTFRQALEVTAGLGRPVSIHSYRSTGLVLKELQRCPVTVPILHWWTGSMAETKKAVELGCYFSIHSAVARHSKFRLHVPPELILVESDHGLNDPPKAIPCRVEWVEFLVAQQYGMAVNDLRMLAWMNFGSIIRKTGTSHLFPKILVAFSARAEETKTQR